MKTFKYRWEFHYSCSKNDYCPIEYEFRRDPVPWTGYNHAGGNYYRRIRTTQERRWSLACDPKFVRGTRNIRHLPNSWDDITNFSRYHKSWKCFGKKRKAWDKKRK